jgi:hypothetical protein
MLSNLHFVTYRHFFIMTTSGHLTGTWDCHAHCFDPDVHPYRIHRAYTPRPAPLDALIRSLVTDNLMLVQATIEQNFDGLLARLEECRKAPYHFSGLIRGTILAYDAVSLTTLSDHEFERMHHFGVRCIRLHGSYGGSGHDLKWVQNQVKALAHLKPVLKYVWSISAQLPMETWSRLKPFILSNQDFAAVSIVADHIACVGASDYESSALKDFLALLQSGRVYVKV